MMRAVFLEPDFEVGPGPAFQVYLVPKANIRTEADMKDVMVCRLSGAWRAFKGSQRLSDSTGHRSEELLERDRVVRSASAF
jgi:hypothetical protein